MMKSQRPPAADDLFIMISGVNVSSASVFLLAVKLLALMVSLSMWPLTEFRVSRKAAGFFMQPRAVFQVLSVFNFPLASTGTSGLILQRILSAQVNVWSIAAGGF